MTPAEETLARIKARREEQARLYRILDLWAAVQAQGTEPEEVQSFGFDPKLLTPTLERERRQGMRGATIHTSNGCRLASTGP